MSTETVYYSRADNIKAEELRRRQADAREARRLAAQRKAEEKARKVALRRISAANKVIREQEQVLEQEIARLDEAANRLPDLHMTAPVLGSLDGSFDGDPAAVEAHAASITEAVQQFSRRLGAAIEEAETLLQRRIAKAAAWREIKGLEEKAALRKRAIDELIQQLGVEEMRIELPARPGKEAELEEVEAYLEALRGVMNEIELQHTSLVNRRHSRERAESLAGETLHSRDAGFAQREYQDKLASNRRDALRQSLDRALVAHELTWEDLPESTRWLIEESVSAAATSDGAEQILRWVSREKQHLEGTNKSLCMMQQVPELVHEDEQLSYRWSRLVERLQRVAGGIDEFETSLEREYQQIAEDASRNICADFTKSDWICAMSGQGFEVFEKEGGNGLVVVDLNNLGVWIDAQELQSRDGAGFGVTMELMTDVESTPQQEKATTEDVCARLGRVNGGVSEKAKAESAVVSHTHKITRGKPPARRLKTFRKEL